MQPQITDADREFLLNRRNWMYGPIFEARWEAHANSEPKSLGRAFLADPYVVEMRTLSPGPYPERGYPQADDAVMLSPHHPPVGVCLLLDIQGVEISVYPPQLSRLLPDRLYHGGSPGPFLDTLVDLTKRLHAKVPLSDASADDEFDGGSWIVSLMELAGLK